MTMETSQTISALADALAKAQASVEGAVKGKVNPAFRSKYADLASVWDACREALTQNGLSVIQSPGQLAEGRMEMTTMLLHASGEWVRGSLTIPLGKADAQGYGSATTYARRFALAAFVGVAPEDDDGNAAAKAAPAKKDYGPSPVDGQDFPGMEGAARVSSYAAKKDGKGTRLNELRNEVWGLESMVACGQWAKERADEIKGFPEGWRKILREDLEEQKHTIQRTLDAEAGAELDGFRPEGAEPLANGAGALV